MLVRGTEVHIVVQYGAPLLGIVQKSLYLRAYDRIQRIVRAIKYDIISVYLGESKVQTVIGVVLIEYVLCIVPLIQERQRQW